MAWATDLVFLRFIFLRSDKSAIVNSVLVLTKEKLMGRDCQYVMRVAKSALMQVEVHSFTITQTSGDAVRDCQFGYDCELTDCEWSLLCGCFFCDPSITKDKAGVRTPLRMLFLHLRSWYNGGGTIDGCPGVWLNYFCQDLVLWWLLMSGSVVDFKDLLVHGWDEGGFLDSFGAGVMEDKIARRLTSLAIVARNLSMLWVDTGMFREEEGVII